uniref:DUF4657 domain-containing protein n=1 Tax=Anser brachyrhynchus TaxID=132585 RepID=A0A8B9CI90_9AVES
MLRRRGAFSVERLRGLGELLGGGVVPGVARSCWRGPSLSYPCWGGALGVPSGSKLRGRLLKSESEDSGVEMASNENSPSTPLGSESSFSLDGFQPARGDPQKSPPGGERGAEPPRPLRSRSASRKPGQQRSRRQRQLSRRSTSAGDPRGLGAEEPEAAEAEGAMPGQGLRYLEHICQMLERVARLQQDNRLLRQQATGARRAGTVVRAGALLWLWDPVGGARNPQLPAGTVGNGALLPSPVPGAHRAHPRRCANTVWRVPAGSFDGFLGSIPRSRGLTLPPVPPPGPQGTQRCMGGEGQHLAFSWAVPVPVQKSVALARLCRCTADIFSIFFYVYIYIYIAFPLRVTVATDFILLKPGPACDVVGKEQLRGDGELGAGGRLGKVPATLVSALASSRGAGWAASAMRFGLALCPPTWGRWVAFV